ncbi:hypothetical protein [Microbispora sp. ATCC PTA-5024]|uniref:hypothetical protein n=1 Tax=Microbispora sp. ATCC PTA-5024 TaxID=316330 RepID=UPI0003DBD31E|nr:hypothetical protein [Microbispora sp. ATCC PTA-5024]ETK36613.1 hypothetical protein MPTA5024_08035 [Microbispora sp. ATCC PTA-5024]
MRTDHQPERRDDLTERPTPESPEPLEEEARREEALAARRDEHEGPGPVFSPAGAREAGTAADEPVDTTVPGERDSFTRDFTRDGRSGSDVDGTRDDRPGSGLDAGDRSGLDPRDGYGSELDDDRTAAGAGTFEGAGDRDRDPALTGDRTGDRTGYRPDDVLAPEAAPASRTDDASVVAPVDRSDDPLDDDPDRRDDALSADPANRPDLGADDTDGDAADPLDRPASEAHRRDGGSFASDPALGPDDTQPDTGVAGDVRVAGAPIVVAPAASPGSAPDMTHVATPVTSAAPAGTDGLAEDVDQRWREIKAGFVDDPRQSVEQADALVDEALAVFTKRRQSLLDQWKNSENSDTEALRLALREYHTLLLQLNGK